MDFTGAISSTPFSADDIPEFCFSKFIISVDTGKARY